MKAKFFVDMPTPAGVTDDGFALYDSGEERLRKRDLASPRHADKPAWWKQGIGCEFGAEIALEKPAPRLVKTA
jgi:hypothetical protein